MVCASHEPSPSPGGQGSRSSAEGWGRCGGDERVRKERAGTWGWYKASHVSEGAGADAAWSQHISKALIISPPVRRLDEGCRRGALALLAFM